MTNDEIKLPAIEMRQVSENGWLVVEVWASEEVIHGPVYDFKSAEKLMHGVSTKLSRFLTATLKEAGLLR